MAGARASKGWLAGPAAAGPWTALEARPRWGLPGAQGALSLAVDAVEFASGEINYFLVCAAATLSASSYVQLAPLSAFYSEGRPPKRPLPSPPSL